MKKKKDTTYKQIIGWNIRYYRGKLKAEKLGRIVFDYPPNSGAQQRIAKFENAKQEPTSSELYKIAAFFEIGMKKFFNKETAEKGRLLQNKTAKREFLKLKKIS